MTATNSGSSFWFCEPFTCNSLSSPADRVARAESGCGRHSSLPPPICVYLLGGQKLRFQICAFCAFLRLKIFRSPSALICVLCGKTFPFCVSCASLRLNSSSQYPFPSVISVVKNPIGGFRGLLKIKSHKPIQGGHKAKQGPKKNHHTSLVNKVTCLPARPLNL